MGLFARRALEIFNLINLLINQQIKMPTMQQQQQAVAPTQPQTMPSTQRVPMTPPPQIIQDQQLRPDQLQVQQQQLHQQRLQQPTATTLQSQEVQTLKEFEKAVHDAQMKKPSDQAGLVTGFAHRVEAIEKQQLQNQIDQLNGIISAAKTSTASASQQAAPMVTRPTFAGQAPVAPMPSSKLLVQGFPADRPQQQFVDVALPQFGNVGPLKIQPNNNMVVPTPTGTPGEIDERQRQELLMQQQKQQQIVTRQQQEHMARQEQEQRMLQQQMQQFQQQQQLHHAQQQQQQKLQQQQQQQQLQKMVQQASTGPQQPQLQPPQPPQPPQPQQQQQQQMPVGFLTPNGVGVGGGSIKTLSSRRPFASRLRQPINQIGSWAAVRPLSASFKRLVDADESKSAAAVLSPLEKQQHTRKIACDVIL